MYEQLGYVLNSAWCAELDTDRARYTASKALI